MYYSFFIEELFCSSILYKKPNSIKQRIAKPVSFLWISTRTKPTNSVIYTKRLISLFFDLAVTNNSITKPAPKIAGTVVKETFDSG